MKGIFGGIISLINIIGGCIIFLLIGERAWKESNTGRRWRLAYGSLCCGLV
jgi:hypothetical protein